MVADLIRCQEEEAAAWNDFYLDNSFYKESFYVPQKEGPRITVQRPKIPQDLVNDVILGVNSNHDTACPSLLSLPIEIRVLIYQLVLRSRLPINIRSPMKKRDRRPNPATKHFGAILLASKKIHGEAVPIFYSVNSFSVGIGHFGSTLFPNMHGIKAFVSRVPTEYLSSIKRILFVVDLEKDRHGNARVFTSSKDILELKKLCQILLKRFTGLQSILLYWNYVSKYSYLPKMSPSMTQDALVKIVRTLIKHPSCRQLFMRVLDGFVPTQDIIRIVQNQELDADSRAISVDDVPLHPSENTLVLAVPQTQVRLTW